MSERVERIRACLQTALSPQRLDIQDDSAKHLGHAGARDGRGHFNVTIVAEQFNDKPLLQRHRLVYTAMQTLLQTDVHALSIKAYTPDEYLSQQS